jgi:uridine kinase
VPPVPDRREVIETLAGHIGRLRSPEILRVAIDGVDGAGKTFLADELAGELAKAGRLVIRASVDGFHNPMAVRYRRGRDSAEGFFLDSYDYDQLKAVLLDPLSPGGSGHYRLAVFDHRSDQPVERPDEVAPPGAVLLLDGIFLHRPELRVYWDYSIFLQVAFAVSIPRCAQRGDGSPDPAAPTNRRYVDGQQLYLRSCDPMSWATTVLNNDDLAYPYIVEPRSTGTE